MKMIKVSLVKISPLLFIKVRIEPFCINKNRCKSKECCIWIKDSFIKLVKENVINDQGNSCSTNPDVFKIKSLIILSFINMMIKNSFDERRKLSLEAI